MKSCDNCYWKGYKDKYCIYEEVKPKENICGEHNYECKCVDVAVVKYEGVPYCRECLLELLEVQEYTITRYVWDGEDIGSDENMDEVMETIISEFTDGEIEQLD